jgi:hypothetical protein
VPAAGQALRQGADVAGQAAEARMAERGLITDRVMSGVDPMEVIDPALAAAGKLARPTKENPVTAVPPTETEPGIIAFHGSGADFDQFSLEKIGTGEGAQAYGYGLYFTDSEDIAKFYRQTVGGGTGIVDFSIGDLDLVRGGEFRDYSPGATPFGRDRRYRRVQGLTAEDYAQAKMIEDIFINEGRLYNEIKKPGAGVIYEPKKGDELKDELIEIIYETLNGIDPTDQPGEIEYIQNFVNSLAREDAEIKLNAKQYGKTYKVALAPKPDELLDYDLPIGNQSPDIKAKISKLIDNEITPDDLENFGSPRGDLKASLLSENRTVVSFLNDFAAIRGKDNAGEELLAKYGIPGIKYFDNASRNTAGGKLIDVTEAEDGFRAKVAVDNRPGGLGGSGRIVTTSLPYKTRQEALDRADEETKKSGHNYVIFDDKMIKILEKYGIVGPVAVTALGATKQESADNGDT